MYIFTYIGCTAHFTPFPHFLSGYLGYTPKYRIYEEIPALAGSAKGSVKSDESINIRESGVYDEIPCDFKVRTVSASSADSSSSSGKKSPSHQIVNDSEKDKTPKRNLAKDLLRRRSFSKVKSELTPKKSLDSVTTEGYVLVSPAASRPRERFDLSLPVNESKGSLLQIVRNLANRSKSYKRRDEDKTKCEFFMRICLLEQFVEEIYRPLIVPLTIWVIFHYIC